MSSDLLIRANRRQPMSQVAGKFPRHANGCFPGSDESRSGATATASKPWLRTGSCQGFTFFGNTRRTNGGARNVGAASAADDGAGIAGASLELGDGGEHGVHAHVQRERAVVRRLVAQTRR